MQIADVERNGNSIIITNKGGSSKRVPYSEKNYADYLKQALDYHREALKYHSEVGQQVERKLRKILK